MPSQSNLSRYRGTTAFISIVLLIETALLGSSLFLSQKAKLKSTSAAIAGQQQLVIEHITASLNVSEPEALTKKMRRDMTNSLQSPLSKIDLALTSLDQGGMLPGPTEASLSLPPVSSEASKAALADASKAWAHSKEQLVHMLFALNRDGELSVAFTGAQQRVLENTEVLKDAVKTLSQTLKTEADNTSKLASALTYAGIALAILSIGLLFFYYLPKISQDNEEKQSEENRVREVLKNLHEGVVVIDRQQRIGEDFSQKACELLNAEGFIGKHLYELLRPIIKPEKINEINQHIATLFDPNKHEPLITDINPARNVEARYNQPDGSYQTRQLQFNFHRIVENDAIRKILVSFGDITASAGTKRGNPDTYREHADMLESQTQLLLTNPSSMAEFAALATPSLQRISQILEEASENTTAPVAMPEKLLNALNNEIVRLQGCSIPLEYYAFNTLINDFEDRLNHIFLKEEVTTENYRLLHSYLDRAFAFLDTLAQLAENDKKQEENPWEALRHFADDTATQAHKHVTTIITGFQEHTLPDASQSLIKEVSEYLVKHSIIHSIEAPKNRLERNKPEQARIDVALNKLEDGVLELSIRDDGAGINFDAIKEQALRHDMAPESELKKWSNRRLFNLSLIPDFWEPPADEELREDNMKDIVHQIREFDGDMEVSTRPGRYTHYIVTLPETTSMDTQETFRADQPVEIQ